MPRRIDVDPAEALRLYETLGTAKATAYDPDCGTCGLEIRGLLPETPIEFRYSAAEPWRSTPFQGASAQCLRPIALRLVSRWLAGCSGGPCPACGQNLQDIEGAGGCEP